jgi:hypothetical protein
LKGGAAVPFVKYTGGVRSYVPRVSISKSGMLSFNEGAKQRFRIGEHGYCVLYYDPDTRRVGIELVNDENVEGARRLRHRDTGSDLAVKSFLDFFDIGVERTTSYPITRDDETGYLVLDLTTGRERGSGKDQD